MRPHCEVVLKRHANHLDLPECPSQKLRALRAIERMREACVNRPVYTSEIFRDLRFLEHYVAVHTTAGIIEHSSARDGYTEEY